jgi:hypothetical protein
MKASDMLSATLNNITTLSYLTPTGIFKLPLLNTTALNAQLKRHDSIPQNPYES